MSDIVDINSTPRAPTASASSRRPRRWDTGQMAVHFVLLIMTLVTVMPFVWLVFASFKTYSDLMNNPGLPQAWVLGNYDEVINKTNFFRAIWNSIVVAGSRVLVVCVTSLAAGYVFAKYHFPGRDLLFVALLTSMMVPLATLLLPLYVTLSDLSLLNSLTGLIAVSMISTFGIFFLRQSIRTISDDYIDAARIDGAGEFWILLQVILPLSRAPLAALAVFTFLGTWDDFLFPSIVLTDQTVQTLPLVLAGLQSLYWDRYELYAAGAMMTVVPVMVLYSLMQKQFVRGITMGGIKG